ncbi:MAG: YibE/F family protein [Bacillota bacterium]|nr:YibE/F family protein [Bacillota bacterium]
MNIILILLIILFILMIVVGGERGSKSFFTLCFNFITLFIMLVLIAYKFDPIKITIFSCILISSITLFHINGFNKKTISALISVTIVVLLTILLSYNIGTKAQIQGFSSEQLEGIAYLTLYIQINFSKVVMCQVLVGLLGAIIDVSISISSSMNEIYKNDSSITERNLFNSGINIGKDILGTMTNTLLFAYIGGFMTLIIYFNERRYSIADIINTKIFCSQIFQILCSGIGIILIIPVTSFITSKILLFKSQTTKQQVD